MNYHVRLQLKTPPAYLDKTYVNMEFHWLSQFLSSNQQKSRMVTDIKKI